MTCLAVALAFGGVAGVMAGRPLVVQDFAYYFHATRLWTAGVDPYQLVPRSDAWPFVDRLFYPVPALVALWPLHALPQSVAVALFVAIPSAGLAWYLSRDETAPHRLLLLATPGYALAAALGQWSPWFTLALLVPSVGALYVCKPTLGLACLLARPSVPAVLGCAVLGTLSLALWPAWPVAWLANLDTVVGHRPPILSVLGIAIAALLLPRWREPRARLVLALACVPQLLFFADQVPLALVARTKRETLFLVGCAWIAAVTWYVRHYGGPTSTLDAEPYALWGCYGPALVVALRGTRTN